MGRGKDEVTGVSESSLAVEGRGEEEVDDGGTVVVKDEDEEVMDEVVEGRKGPGSGSGRVSSDAPRRGLLGVTTILAPRAGPL